MRRAHITAIPTVAEARESMQRAAVEKMIELLEQEQYTQFKHAADELLGQYDSTALVSVALKLLSREKSDVPVQLTSETPRYARKSKIQVQEKSRRTYKGNRELGKKGSRSKRIKNP